MEKTLVVLAAGMGSRFGGLKQITPINDYDLFLIDYAIFDAIKNGFTKVVFIIKKEHLNLFEDTIGQRIRKQIEVEYAFQSTDDLIADYPDLKNREKPLGTAHALYAAKDIVKTPFVIINADDFNSYHAYEKASEFIKNNFDEKIYASVNYPFNVTASKYGSVKRGFIDDDNGFVTSISENIAQLKDDQVVCESLDNKKSSTRQPNHLVAVNFFVLYPTIFNYLEAYFYEFLKIEENRQDKEFLLPVVLCDLIEKKEIKLKNIISPGTWAGMTYKEDLKELKAKIQELENKKIYKPNLWEK